MVDADDIWDQGNAPTFRLARPRYRLEDLVAAITPENRPEAVEFPPAGEELL